MALQSELNGRMLEIVRELTGAAMITLPSSVHDFESPETASDMERYMRSASSDAKSRVALMRLAWDSSARNSAAAMRSTKSFTAAPRLSLSRTPTATSTSSALPRWLTLR